MAFEISDSSLSVEYNSTFSLTFSGARGVVSASVPLLYKPSTTLSVSQGEGAATGSINGEFGPLIATGSTFNLTVTDTYLDDDEQEQTESLTCAITITTDGIIADLDTLQDQSVFARQQALCDNQVVIAKKINTVRNLIISNLVVSITSLASNIATVVSMLNNIDHEIDDLDVNISASGKNTVTIG